MQRYWKRDLLDFLEELGFESDSVQEILEVAEEHAFSYELVDNDEEGDDE